MGAGRIGCQRFHPDTRFLDLAERRGLDGIFSALEKSNLVVMDCRAASTDLFIDFFNVIDVSTVLSAMGAALTFIMPVSPCLTLRISCLKSAH
ncbi:MAG: hypothetical protein ABR955_14860 [Verrucomicrobiota bacterium]